MKQTSNQADVDMVRRRVEQAASVSAEERVLCGLRHSDLSILVVEDGIRNHHPDASDEQIKQLLIERIELMRRMERRHEHL